MLYGLIGHPLTHSFSQRYFTEKFAQLGIPARYENFPIGKIELLPQLIAAHPDLRGLNVTIPYKEQVLPFLHTLDATAAAVGAVNTIRIDGDRMLGYNTDVYGFRQSIKPFLTSAHERALILGSGGASKAVYYALKEIGIDCFFVSRDKNKLPGKNVLGWEELNEYVMQAFKLIVNTTPLGMFPDVEEAPALPYSALTPEHLLYDLIYNPAETQFMKRGKAAGATAMNGLDMLRLQAEQAWQIWNP